MLRLLFAIGVTASAPVTMFVLYLGIRQLLDASLVTGVICSAAVCLTCLSIAGLFDSRQPPPNH